MTTRYLVGTVLDVLATLPDGTVDLVASSPPFLGLRSYLPPDHPTKAHEIGSEATPADFLDALLNVVEACGRVLAPHGSLAFELGDSYAGSGGAGGDYNAGGLRDGQERFNGAAATRAHAEKARWRSSRRRDQAVGLLPPGRDAGHGTGWPLDKSLCLIPSLFAASLAYGRNVLRPERTIEPWRVRNLVAWCRPNPAVGALSDKCRAATSYITIATRARDRYWDMDACRGAGSPNTHSPVQNGDGTAPLKDYWEISTEPSALAHYAMWPSEVARRLILLMCPREVCRTCAEPGRRLTKTTNAVGKGHRVGRWAPQVHSLGDKLLSSTEVPDRSDRVTLGWSTCGHDDYRPGVVLDPFAGAGTTAMVAAQLGRDSVSVDLKEEYAAIARRRIAAYGVLEVTTRDGTPAAPVGQVAML